ncbi:MAG TPA: metalloregulator ArsR/SmtB family transcription factor [Steroidobacteraceae bacterium]
MAPPVLVQWLRAAGEPTRLRLLALCAEGVLSVSDLAQALKQSEPRVSRHLKILCEAGLIVRLRQGQWVHYRVADGAEAASFVRGLLARLDRGDPVLLRDRSGARAAAAPDAHGSESRLGRALAGLVAGGGLPAALAAVLVIGVSHPELLETAALAGERCTAIAHSRRAAQSARAFAERRGFTCRVLQATSPDGLSDTDIARTGQPFDAVLLDTSASGETLARMLEHARRVLTPAGRLWIFERYESLESPRERIVEHPLARLRRLLGDAGLVCERLSPVEADGEHVLAAVARVAGAAPGQLTRAAGARP